MKNRNEKRSKFRMLKLPEEVLAQVDKMILGVGPERRGYTEIAEWLKGQGYQTSKSAVARYAQYLFKQIRAGNIILKGVQRL